MEPRSPASPIVRQPLPPAITGGNSQAFELTPKDIVGIIRRHFFLIVILTVLGTVAGGVSWYLLLRFSPKYTARTAINVLPPGQTDPIRIDTSMPNKDLYFQFRTTKANIIKQQSMLEELLRRDKIRESQWFKHFNNNIADAVEDLQNNLGVSPQREGNWIIVSMTCGNKQEAALIVNETVDLFLTKQREDATRDIRAQLGERQAQKEELNKDLRQAQNTLRDIRGATQFSDVASGNFESYLSEKLQDVEIQFNELESNISRTERQVEILRQRAQGEYDEVLREQMERDITARNMRERIANLEVGRAQLLARFGENHRRVKELDDALQQAKQDLQERQLHIADVERKSNLRNAEDALTTLASELETLQKQRNDARREYKTLDNLRAEYQEAETIRDEVQTRLDQINLNLEKLKMLISDPDISKVKSVGPAPEPLVPSFPQMIIFIPAGFLMGGMLGVGLAFAIELLNDRLRAPRDVFKYVKVPLLGMIFHESEDDSLKNVDPRLVVGKAPYSIISECYRQLKTNLKLSGSGQTHRTIFISSCRPGCGKTSVASNLAATFISEGKKALIIDTNFRKPAIAGLMPESSPDDTIESSDAGLSNYLMDQCEYEAIIRHTGLDGLDIIDTGPLPAHPAALVGNDRMKDLLTKVKNIYDYVIIDGPPLMVSDAKTLATQSDGTIVVFNASSTRRGEAQRALRELKTIDVNVLGAVLLGVKTLRGGYFHEIFKYYHSYQDHLSLQPAQA